MKIRRLTAVHARIPLRNEVTHASHRRTENDTLLIVCELSDGTTGWGEGLPRPYVTGETIESVWDQLQRSDLSRQLDGAWDGLTGAVERLAEVTLARPAPSIDLPEPRRDALGNTIRCALELSLLDALCRTEGVPLSAVTSAVPEAAPLCRSTDSVEYSGAITAMSAGRQWRSALKQRLYGLRHLKVKVGVAGQDDVATLRRIRSAVGRRVDLRIDANEAWCPGDVIERVARLRPFGISAVEQPVPHRDVGSLADVRPRLGVPVILDESLCTQSDGERAIAAGLCDLFNLRLSKCGGFVNSLRLAVLAHAAGLACQLGCQVGETGILSAAGRHFATSVGGLRYVEGSYDRHLVREPLTVEDCTFSYGGRAPALRAPGLGVTIDLGAVRRCTVRQITLAET